jgi:hypothetical protein
MRARRQETGKGRRELQYRMQFAELYPTEDKVCNALQTLESWRQVIKKFLSANGKPAPKRHEKRDAVVGGSCEGPGRTGRP